MWAVVRAAVDVGNADAADGVDAVVGVDGGAVAGVGVAGDDGGIVIDVVGVDVVDIVGGAVLLPVAE